MKLFYSGGREEKLLERILDRPETMVTYWKTFDNKKRTTKDLQRIFIFKRRKNEN